MTEKKTLCLDFDGVLHSYTSPWLAADCIPDPPVEGAMDFLWEALQNFHVVIFSSRSADDNGIRQMRLWIWHWARRLLPNDAPEYKQNAVINAFVYNKDAFPKDKPSAFITLDDRAITFTGEWPRMSQLLAFKPWNK